MKAIQKTAVPVIENQIGQSGRREGLRAGDDLLDRVAAREDVGNPTLRLQTAHEPLQWHPALGAAIPIGEPDVPSPTTRVIVHFVPDALLRLPIGPARKKDML